MAEKSNQSGFQANDVSSADVSPSGYFSSFFDSPSKVAGCESNYFSIIEKKNDSGNQFSGVKTGFLDAKTSTSTVVYNQEETVQPFHYSSSIYYGGQDFYSRPQDCKDPSSPITFKKEGEEDDSNSASRGNWWQGSLYY